MGRSRQPATVSSRRIVRYAVVGLGHIAQVAVLPAFAHARRNSRLVAVVSDDRTKRREIARRYGVEQTFTYDAFDDCRTTKKSVGKRDQFAPELLYFSDCILNDTQPEPSGEEGLQDVRIVQALYRSARTGRPVGIRPFRKSRRPTSRQRMTRPGVKKPALIKVQSASRD